MDARRSVLLLAAAALILGGLTACDDNPDPARTVPVEFELQLINARANSWGFGIDGGPGEGGSGGVNETKTGFEYARIGQPVFCKAFAEHWDSSDPGHQLICRIIVDDEEIYMCADQGTPGDEAAVECGGPVYLPDEDD